MLASAIMLAFGLWWLAREVATAKEKREGFGDGELPSAAAVADDEKLRERAALAREFDPAEIRHGGEAALRASIPAAAPIGVVILVNLVLSLVVCRVSISLFSAKPELGETSASVAGV